MKSLLVLLVIVSVVMVGPCRAQGQIIAPIRGWFSSMMSGLGRAAEYVGGAAGFVSTVTKTVTVTVTGKDAVIREEITSPDDLMLDTTTISTSDSTGPLDLMERWTTSATPSIRNATTLATTVPKTTTVNSPVTSVTKSSPSLVLAVRQGSRFFASLRKPKDESDQDDVILSPSKVLKVEHSVAAQMPYVVKRSVDIESSLMAANHQQRRSVESSHSTTDFFIM